MYCVWQVVKTSTIILNNPVVYYHRARWTHVWLVADAQGNFNCPCSRCEVIWGSGGLVPPTLYIVSRWMLSAPYPCCFMSGERASDGLWIRGFCGPQSWTPNFGEGKNFFPPLAENRKKSFRCYLCCYLSSTHNLPDLVPHLFLLDNDWTISTRSGFKVKFGSSLFLDLLYTSLSLLWMLMEYRKRCRRFFICLPFPQLTVSFLCPSVMSSVSCDLPTSCHCIYHFRSRCKHSDAFLSTIALAVLEMEFFASAWPY